MCLIEHLIDKCFHIFSRKWNHDHDHLQHPSPVARENGSCSSFQRGHQQLISSALEANTDIDTHHTGLHAPSSLSCTLQAWLNICMNVCEHTTRA